MSDWWMYTNYPKLSRKVTKLMLIFVMVSIPISYLADQIIKHNQKKYQTKIIGRIKDNVKYFSDTSIYFQLAEYPNINFAYKNYNDKSNFEGVDELMKIGDSLEITINKADLKKNDIVAIDLFLMKNKKYLSAILNSSSEKDFFVAAFFIVTFFILLIYFILDKLGVLDKLKEKYFTEPKSSLTTLVDFREFMDDNYYRNTIKRNN